MARMVRRRGILGGIALVGAAVAVFLIASRSGRERRQLDGAGAAVQHVSADSTLESDGLAAAHSEVEALKAEASTEHGRTIRGRLLRYPDPEALEPTQPVAGALLRLSLDEDADEENPDFGIRDVRSGPDGRFQFTDVPAKWWYRLLVDAEGFALRAVRFDLSGLEERKELPDIVLEEPEELVVAVKGPKGSALDTVTVSASSGSLDELLRGGELSTYSAEIEAEKREGTQFIFTRLPRGRVEVTARAPGFVSDWRESRVPNADPLELRLVKGNEISGTVRSTEGVPLPGVTVRGEDKRVKTDDQGRFVLGGVNATEGCDIEVYAKGFSRIHRRLMNTPELDLVLPREAVLSGHVLSAGTGLPLAGATVAIEQNEQQRVNALTDANGAFLLDGLSQGSYGLLVRHPEHAPLFAGIWNLAEGDRVTQLELRLDPALTVTGRVLSAKTGTPVPDAHVRASSATVTSDASGSFVLKGLLDEEYLISVTAEGFSETTAGAAPTLPSEAWTFLLDEEACVRGRVLDADGRPVAGARVHAGYRGKPEDVFAVFAKSWQKHAPTDSRGTYRLTGLPPFTDYCLLATVEGKLAFTCVEGISLESGERKTVDLQLSRGGAIRGQVRSSANSRLTDITVRVSAAAISEGWTFPALHGFVHPVLSVDPSGKFEILNVSPHAYRIHVTSERQGEVELDDVEVEEGSERRLDIVLEEGFSVSGRVVDAAAKPVEGATVTVSGGVETRNATSDEKGLFTVSGLPRRRGAIEVQRFGFHGPRLYCEIPSSGNLVAMAPAPVISGTVIARGRNILPECSVRASRTDGEEEFWGESDGAGRFTMALAPGKYFVQPEAKGFASTPVRIELKPGEKREVALELIQSGSIRVRLEVEGSPGTGSKDVYLEDPTGASFARTGITEMDGSVRFEDVLPGPSALVAVVWNHGIAREDRIVVTAGATTEVNITVPAARGIFGRVTRLGDEPLPGARVRASGPGGSHLSHTSPNGWYQIEDLEPGAYEVQVEEAATRTVSVTEGEPTRLDVELAAALVSGSVTFDGRPVAGVGVTASSLLGSVCGSIWTDDHGEWSLELRAPEEYVIWIGEENTGALTRSLVLVEGQTQARLDVVLERSPVAEEPEGPEAPADGIRSENEN